MPNRLDGSDLHQPLSGLQCLLPGTVAAHLGGGRQYAQEFEGKLIRSVAVPKFKGTGGFVQGDGGGDVCITHEVATVVYAMWSGAL